MDSKISYFIKQGFKNIKAHKAMSVASVCIVAAALSLLGLFAAAGINVSGFMSRIEDSCKVSVYMQSGTEVRISETEDELKKIPGVKAVSFCSREERMEKVSREVYGDDGYVFKDGENPLRDSFIITLNNLSEGDAVAKAAGAVEGVEEVVQSKDIIGGVTTALRAVKSIGVWIMTVLVILALLIVYNTIRLGMSAFSDEISIMRIVGAADSFITAPFVVQGLLLGAIGAVLADILVLICYAVLGANISALVSSPLTELVSMSKIALYLTAMLIGTGGAIGVIGSAAAVVTYK